MYTLLKLFLMLDMFHAHIISRASIETTFESPMIVTKHWDFKLLDVTSYLGVKMRKSALSKVLIYEVE